MPCLVRGNMHPSSAVMMAVPLPLCQIGASQRVASPPPPVLCKVQAPGAVQNIRAGTSLGHGQGATAYPSHVPLSTLAPIAA